MILYIDTTEKKFIIRLFDAKGHLLSEYISVDEKNHTDDLLNRIEEQLQKKSSNIKKLQKIIVMSGPGSYTGIRVGVATANALAYSLSIPIFGVRKDMPDALDAALKSNLSVFTDQADVYYEGPPHITKPKIDT